MFKTADLSSEGYRVLCALLADALVNKVSCQEAMVWRCDFQGWRLSVCSTGLRSVSYSVFLEGALIEQGDVRLPAEDGRS